MSEPQPDVRKDIRLHIAKLSEAMDSELEAEMEKLMDWWLEKYYVVGSDGPPRTLE